MHGAANWGLCGGRGGGGGCGDEGMGEGQALIPGLGCRGVQGGGGEVRKGVFGSNP